MKINITAVKRKYRYSKKVLDRAIPEAMKENPFGFDQRPMKIFDSDKMDSGDFYLRPVENVREGEQITYTYNEEKARGLIK